VSVAVITGAGGGIGTACARSLASEHDTLVLVDRSPELLAATTEAIADGGTAVTTIACDITDCADMTALADAVEVIGPLGALVHTAGVGPSAGDPRRIVDVNLRGTLLLLDAFTPLVGAGTAGVCFASMSGHREVAKRFDALLVDPVDPVAALDRAGVCAGHPGVAYAASKRGVIVQCQRRAATWGARGGRLVSVSPGLVADTIMGGQALQGYAGTYATWSAIGRAGRSAEIAAAVAFLCSPAASFITGTDLLLDGGMLAHIDRHLPPEARGGWHAHLS
jgi:NAD(P)-dependent dehydrogenase (short-subunit alcohol dehydrogenase family)